MFDQDIDLIYLIALEIEGTIGTTRSDSYLDLHIEIERHNQV